MICQGCGLEAETKHVAFYQNIGALVIRFPSSIEGNLCKSCIHRYFWKMTGTTMFLGWWGMISAIVTPFFLLNNLGRYLFCLGMEPVPQDSIPPRLTENVVDRINPYANDLFSRLSDGEDFTTTMKAIADRADVTPGQVALYVQAVIEAHQNEEE